MAVEDGFFFSKKFRCVLFVLFSQKNVNFLIFLRYEYEFCNATVVNCFL